MDTLTLTVTIKCDLDTPDDAEEVRADVLETLAARGWDVVVTVQSPDL